MPIVTIAQVGSFDGQDVTLRGWLYNLRESGSRFSLYFAMVRERSRESSRSRISPLRLRRCAACRKSRA